MDLAGLRAGAAGLRAGAIQTDCASDTRLWARVDLRLYGGVNPRAEWDLDILLTAFFDALAGARFSATRLPRLDRSGRE
jgi:hypothetical protein